MPGCCDYIGPVFCLEICFDALGFVMFCKIALAIQGLLYFQMNSVMVFFFSRSDKNVVSVLIGMH